MTPPRSLELPRPFQSTTISCPLLLITNRRVCCHNQEKQQTNHIKNKRKTGQVVDYYATSHCNGIRPHRSSSDAKRMRGITRILSIKIQRIHPRRVGKAWSVMDARLEGQSERGLCEQTGEQIKKTRKAERDIDFIHYFQYKNWNSVPKEASRCTLLYPPCNEDMLEIHQGTFVCLPPLRPLRKKSAWKPSRDWIHYAEVYPSKRIRLATMH